MYFFLWALKTMKRLQTTEMRMLRTLRDGVSNETIGEITGMENRIVLVRAETAMVWAQERMDEERFQ